jgi:hypothetical protein
MGMGSQSQLAEVVALSGERIEMMIWGAKAPNMPRSSSPPCSAKEESDGDGEHKRRIGPLPQGFVDRIDQVWPTSPTACMASCPFAVE